jgi:anti-sigma factor RsiW
MTERMTCPSKEDLVTWLYGEADDAARAAVEAHLHSCAGCREEADALTGVRVGLASWTAPELPVHVRIVPDVPARP